MDVPDQGPADGGRAAPQQRADRGQRSGPALTAAAAGAHRVVGEHARMVAALIVVPFLVLSLYPAVGGAPFVGMVG